MSTATALASQERIRNKLRESILMLCRDRRGEGDDEPIPAVETDEVVPQHTANSVPPGRTQQWRH